MNSAAIVAMIIGTFMVLSRGPLLVAPAATLGLFKKTVETKARTRMLGGFAVLLAALMVWSGVSQSSTLESVMFIFGVFILLFAGPALLFFPHVYMSIAAAVLPDDLSGSLVGWRVMGLLGIIIGIAVFRFGMVAL